MSNDFNTIATIRQRNSFRLEKRKINYAQGMINPAGNAYRKPAAMDDVQELLAVIERLEQHVVQLQLQIVGLEEQADKDRGEYQEMINR